MTEIQDLLDAFQMHYAGLKYTAGQRKELTERYSWIRPAYKVAVYEAVVTTHPAALRSLPDMAVIESAMRGLNRPESYEPPQPLLEDMTEAVHDSVRDAINAKAKRDGELNHEERNRVRQRVLRGQATEYERFWIRAIDEHGGDWRLAVAKEAR